MSKVLELKRTRKELYAKMTALSEKQGFGEDDEKSFLDMKAQCEGLAKQVERVEFLESERAILDRIEDVPSKPRPDAEPAKKVTAGGGRKVVENPGFANVGEMMYVSLKNPNDPRIRALMEMGTGESGGLAIPDDINPTLQEVKPQEAIFRPRATVVPAGQSPDADMTLPAVNQSAAANMYGGVQVDWVSEGAPKPETQAKLRETKWSPKEVAAKIVVTDKLLRNWAAANSFIERMLRGALLAAEDVAFLKGDGLKRPKGVLASDALKKVHRAQAGKIAYADLVNMEGELHDDAGAVWIVNPRTIPQLRQMVDGAGRFIWIGDRPIAEDPGGVSTLLGRPVLKNYRSPALGSLGDVVLLVPSYYVIKDGVDVTIAASEHALFGENKTVVKAFKSVDGGPWLDGPIAQEDGTTYSPFVALDVP